MYEKWAMHFFNSVSKKIYLTTVGVEHVYILPWLACQLG